MRRVSFVFIKRILIDRSQFASRLARTTALEFSEYWHMPKFFNLLKNKIKKLIVYFIYKYTINFRLTGEGVETSQIHTRGEVWQISRTKLPILIVDGKCQISVYFFHFEDSESDSVLGISRMNLKSRKSHFKIERTLDAKLVKL